eukprot:CAMPEP_0184007290 /NCGR_PEP_ID=MMETSP0954-20121128/1238_1 /TAXON_ID=627963 /ORGANISM="Aplanochytrium sp, Strain PBS07" /LENGTH=331 /DNA_ID=CAMNT_0026286077 /DNA_START=70 /DNA_END=1065 /DNA_ORIENTATION=+
MANVTIDPRALLRKGQRELQEFVQKKQAELADFNSDVADQAFQRIQKQHDECKSTREACVDSTIFRGLSNHTSKQAVQLGLNSNSITWTHFLKGLKHGASTDGVSIDWESLGQSTSVFFNTPIGVNFMIGPLSVPKRVINQNAQRQRRKATVAEKPATIKHEESKNAKKTEHEKFQKFLCSKLESGKQGMFDFLFNPKSFTQTVENIFEFSFLVKDGWSSISVDQNELSAQPVVEYQNPHEDRRKTSEKQTILSFNMNDFENLKRAYDVRQATLPHRQDKEYDEARAGNDSDHEIVDEESDSEDDSQRRIVSKRKTASSANDDVKRRKADA